MITASPWWTPHVHADRRPRLLARNAIQNGLRQWFAEHDFIEVTANTLQVSPGNEAHLSAFGTELMHPDGSRRPYYLATSPEFAAKKLLAAGEPRLFSLGPVYRNRERGPLHHPEFTMLEWYRAGEPYEVLMQDCAAFLALSADRAGCRTLTFRGRQADPHAEPGRVSVAEAFDRFAGIDLLATVSVAGETDEPALRAGVEAAGIRTAPDDSWADLYSRVMVEKIEPRLGDGRATFLYEYPVSEAALSRPVARDPRVAERFELYCCGVELANAFGELTDPVEQRRRFNLEMDEKERVYGERYPLDEDFLEALDLMPEASGIALGFDRLAMLATAANRIDDVVWTPMPE